MGHRVGTEPSVVLFHVVLFVLVWTGFRLNACLRPNVALACEMGMQVCEPYRSAIFWEEANVGMVMGSALAHFAGLSCVSVALGVEPRRPHPVHVCACFSTSTLSWYVGVRVPSGNWNTTTLHHSSRRLRSELAVWMAKKLGTRVCAMYMDVWNVLR